MLPSIFLPTYLRNTLGYRTARAGLDAGAQPVHGDQPRLRRLRADADPQRHGGDAADSSSSTTTRPSFYLLNVGETHYPYALPDEDPSRVAADLRRPRRLQAPRRRGRRADRRADASSSTRRGCASCTTARSRPSATSTACSRALFDLLPDEHVGDRHLRPRRALRRGPLLRPRAGHAREGARGPVRRGPRPLSRPRAAPDDGRRARAPHARRGGRPLVVPGPAPDRARRGAALARPRRRAAADPRRGLRWRRGARRAGARSERRSGSSPRPPSRERALARGAGEVVDGDLERGSRSPTTSSTCAVCLDVLEHLDDDRGALAELRRVVARPEAPWWSPCRRTRGSGAATTRQTTTGAATRARRCAPPR